MNNTKTYNIDFEMTDGGKLIGAEKSDDFIYKYLVNQQRINIYNKVYDLKCSKHNKYPEVEEAITDRLLTVIRVKCCCIKFQEIVSERFNEYQKIK